MTLLNIGQILTAHARLQPAKIAARDLSRTMNYRQWNRRTCRLANALLGFGLQKGDRVAVLAYNRVEWAEIYAATAKSGLVTVPINFCLTGPEALYILKNCGATVIIVEADLIPIIESVRDDLAILAGRLIVIGDDTRHSGWRDYETFLSTGTARESEVAVYPDDPWSLMYTSGTTGHPKGAIRSYRGMAMLALMTEIELGLHRRDDALLVIPMYHANSFNFFTAFAYCGGAVTIFRARVLTRNYACALFQKPVQLLPRWFQPITP